MGIVDLWVILTSVTSVTFMLIVYILLIIAWWKIFEKAGVPGWHSLIPFLNAYDEFKISWGNGWLFLLLLIPIVNIVIYIIMTVKMGNAFGKSTAFIVGMVFIPNLFYLILGFGSSSYIGPSTS